MRKGCSEYDFTRSETINHLSRFSSEIADLKLGEIDFEDGP